MQPGLLRPDEAATQTQAPRDSAAGHCRGCAQKQGRGDGEHGEHWQHPARVCGTRNLVWLQYGSVQICIA